MDTLARSLVDTGLPHPLLVDIAREAIAAGDPESAAARADAAKRSMLQRVINATGTLLHTNLGRAPVGVEQPFGYRNLELDLQTGQRGSRQSQAPMLLAKLCGAESAIVVNNCASAVMLILAALAGDKGVAVSRGELVEIGGGFRVPDVMEQSGARLIEVGTTNRTRRSDYERRIADPATDVAMVMQIHQSNYRITGFTEMPTTAELADLGVPLVSDIGSGLLDAACPWLTDGPPTWLAEEPAAKQTLEAGASLVAFSGDKLLGGPQAGVIAGDAELVGRCAAHPLARALRPGGLVLEALQDLALAYLRRDGQSIPFWRIATQPTESLRTRANALGVGSVVDTNAVPGGGTLPTVEIPSVGIALPGDHRAALRSAPTAIMARVEDDTTICDLRTVDPADDDALGEAIRALT
ncbi:MAG: L-seryl-tRNA(Sec) selenium transferase [Acidimicrobiales bacterium]|nr:MAG: L-seryl-tRNA(Sec) selenium transferase [Acidimicrobiales bacterium]